MRKPDICLVWVLLLLSTHLTLRILRPDLGPEPGDLMFAFFFGLNLPTMALAAWGVGKEPPPQRAFASPVFIGGMVLVAIAFMSAPVGGPAKAGLGGLLCMLTAQSLWLAWPVFWAARARALADDAAPGPVQKS